MIILLLQLHLNADLELRASGTGSILIDNNVNIPGDLNVLAQFY